MLCACCARWYPRNFVVPILPHIAQKHFQSPVSNASLTRLCETLSSSAHDELHLKKCISYAYRTVQLGCKLAGWNRVISFCSMPVQGGLWKSARGTSGARGTHEALSTSPLHTACCRREITCFQLQVFSISHDEYTFL